MDGMYAVQSTSSGVVRCGYMDGMYAVDDKSMHELAVKTMLCFALPLRLPSGKAEGSADITYHLLREPETAVDLSHGIVVVANPWSFS